MAAGFEGEIPADIYPIIVCERMQWTYQEYLLQPKWFIEGLSTMWAIKANLANKQKNA